MRSPNIIDAYTNTITGDDLDEAFVVMLDHQRVVSYNDEDTYLISLGAALRTAWPDDAHVTQYHNTSGIRVKKINPGQVVFECAFYDLDWDHHQTEERPTEHDYANLIRTCYVMGVADGITPSAVYPTRCGARLVYLTTRLTDPEQFEAKRDELGKKVARWFARSRYKFDTRCSDWTRLFRLPRVIRRNDDGSTTDLRHTQVHVFHSKRLAFNFNAELHAIRQNIEEIKTGRKAKIISLPKDGPGTLELEYAQLDGTLAAYCERMKVVGQRNDTLFKALCYVLSKYEPSAAAELFEGLREHAMEYGLPREEVDRTIASAKETAVSHV